MPYIVIVLQTSYKIYIIIVEDHKILWYTCHISLWFNSGLKKALFHILR